MSILSRKPSQKCLVRISLATVWLWAAIAGQVLAADLTHDEFQAELPATQRVYVESLARSIKKNVPGAKQADPTSFTYGDPDVRSAMTQRALAAVEAGKDQAAIEAWVELFKSNNAHFAHSAGYEASPEVLREVARFYLVINKSTRDENAVGSLEYRIWDSVVQATQRMIDAK